MSQETIAQQPFSSWIPRFLPYALTRGSKNERSQASNSGTSCPRADRETMESLRVRRSGRLERRPAVAVRAARWAASSYNEQPWRYIVATKAEPAEFARLLSCLVEGNQPWAQAAPVLAIGCTSLNFAKNGQPNAAAHHDLGLASASLTLEATARGLSVHQMIGIVPESRPRTVRHSRERTTADRSCSRVPGRSECPARELPAARPLAPVTKAPARDCLRRPMGAPSSVVSGR